MRRDDRRSPCLQLGTAPVPSAARRAGRSAAATVLIVAALLVTAAVPAAAQPADVSAANPLATQTVVSLTFDDAQATAYAARAPLADRGMSATFYVNSGLAGTAGFYMDWTQLHELAADGHEMGGHTAHHVDLTSVDPATATKEVCDDRTQLLSHFPEVSSFAYPYAAWNPTVRDIVQACGYTSARGIGSIGGLTPGSLVGCTFCPAAESLPPQDPYLLRTPEAASSTTTLATLQSHVLHAEATGGGWVIFVFHGLCHTVMCENANDVPLQTFTALLDWLALREPHGTVVRTVGQAMASVTAPAAPTGVAP